jgi:hypothetical protein
MLMLQGAHCLLGNVQSVIPLGSGDQTIHGGFYSPGLEMVPRRVSPSLESFQSVSVGSWPCGTLAIV